MTLVACTADERAKSQSLKKYLQNKFGFLDVGLNKKFGVIIVCGGDGTMLHTIHKYMHLKIPFYGINTGNLGFLMNNEESIKSHNFSNFFSNSLKEIEIHPLHMKVTLSDGEEKQAIAINEVSVLRSTHQTAHIKILVNGKTQMQKLISDGLLLSTPAGSSAYNLSAGGPIIPLKSNILSLTPISPFRPRRWKGALLNENAVVEFVSLEKSRPINAVADFNDFTDVRKVEIKIQKNNYVKLLFNENTSLEDRIVTEQFLA
ncbi:MAG: NAD kinase [Rickettsiales bacterium]